MGKRRARKEAEGTLNLKKEIVEDDEIDEGEDKKEPRFYACYLLTSLCPRFKGHTYIGFTVNPRRRIRQHNGEIGSGAWRTKKKRPWEMVLCIYGFPTNVSALQFEWAWQHPVESLAVRAAAASFKSLSGLANKIKLAYTMLCLPPWNSLNITVNLFSTKYTSCCPSLPERMCVQICSMDELPCYDSSSFLDDENKCRGTFDDSETSSEAETRSPSSVVNAFSDRITTELDRSLEKYSAAGMPIVVEELLLSDEVIIIDLLSPSPCSNIKKRRLPNVCGQIIDLTNSPIML